MGSAFFSCARLQTPSDYHPIPNTQSQYHYNKECVVSRFITKHNKSAKTFIPREITTIIALYYSFNFSVKFNRSEHGKYLTFLTNTKIQKLDHGNRFRINKHGCSTCLLDTMITAKMCNKFAVDFKLSKANDASSFFIGYVTSQGCIKNWNHGLGEGDNKYSTFGLYINHRTTMKLSVYSLNREVIKYPTECYKTNSYFKDGDVFTMMFDFMNDCIEIYHNYRYADRISLQGHKSLIPGVSIWNLNASVEIVKCDYS